MLYQGAPDGIMVCFNGRMKTCVCEATCISPESHYRDTCALPLTNVPARYTVKLPARLEPCSNRIIPKLSSSPPRSSQYSFMKPSNRFPTTTRRGFLAAASAWVAMNCVDNSSAIQAVEADDPSIWKGESLAGWMTIDGNPAPSGWEAKDGVIRLRKTLFRSGHIVTRQEFGDFELSFDWKIAPGGNSGLKYRVRTYGDRTIGCEYQIFDDPSGTAPANTQTGSIYDLYEPIQGTKAHAAGEWNAAKIVVKDNRIEHWINGVKIVEATVGDAEWERRIAISKFNDVENFSKNPKGRIMLTDHGSEAWYRNMKFEEFGGSGK